MREGSEKQRHNNTGRHRILQVLTILTANILAPEMLSQVDASRQQEAHADAMQTIKECREPVRCALGKISLARQHAKCPDARNVDSEPTGEIITLGGQNFKVRKSAQCGGTLLEAPDGTLFVVPDLKITTDIVNSFIHAQDKTVASNQ